jgi:YD repeat-containing protein
MGALNTVEPGGRPKKSIFRYLRWREFVFIAAGIALGTWVDHHYVSLRPTDYQKWQVRPQLSSPEKGRGYAKTGQSGLAPCFFIVPKGVLDKDFVSRSVGDCLLLLPDGSNLDLFEIPLWGPLVHIKTDLYVPDVMPLAFTRCTIPLDDWATRNRVYVPHVYDLFMYGSRMPYTYVNWDLPDREEIHFERVSPGTSYEDAVFESKSDDPTFSRARVAWNGWGWDLNLQGGLTVLSPEAYWAKRPQQGSVVGIFDREGHEVRVERDSEGDLKKIVSPGGKSIQLKYRRGRMAEAKDSLGNSSKYTYDADGRLLSVDYSSGSAVKYAYDSANRIVEVDGSPLGSVLKLTYGASGLIEQAEVDGGAYNIRRLNRAAEITGPKGEVTRVLFAQREGKWTYTVEAPQPAGD